jgi:glycerophosphoryl diester phosphodiesterase
MSKRKLELTLAGLATLLAACAGTAQAGTDDDDYRAQHDRGGHARHADNIQVGTRPYYLVQGMDPGKLKDKLLACEDGPFRRTDFSIGHRGAALQFPEHTKEAYQAGARLGAGIVECDVTFTKDGELVCRHDECDLATTTNIVNTPLNAACTTPWSPGTTPRCCASDLTLSQFKMLTGKMDASVPTATTPAGFLGGTASWRTDLYTGRGTLMTLKESIALNESLGVKHTPELKFPANPQRVVDIFGSQEKYAQKMIDTFKAAGVDPRDVWPQSFNKADVIYWVQHEPRFGRQAVYLDDIDPTVTPPIPRLSMQELRDLRAQGVRIFAPPMFALLAVDANNEIVPSQYARDIKAAGLDIITWTFERADLRQGASKAGFYYLFDPLGQAVKKDADMYKALDVLAKKVGVLGIFSDWPATVTYYASCMGLK